MSRRKSHHKVRSFYSKPAFTTAVIDDDSGMRTPPPPPTPPPSTEGHFLIIDDKLIEIGGKAIIFRR